MVDVLNEYADVVVPTCDKSGDDILNELAVELKTNLPYCCNNTAATLLQCCELMFSIVQHKKMLQAALLSRSGLKYQSRPAPE